MPTLKDLAKIHIAKRELKLSDKLYREFLFLLFQKDSAKDLESNEVEELLNHFKSFSWQDKIPFTKKKYNGLGRRPGMASPAQLRKIEINWMTGEGVRIKTSLALRHFLRHYFHVSDLRFVRADQVSSILGAIKKISQRELEPKNH